MTDLPGAESADGVVRCARKVLVDSTKALARSRSYSWALLEKRISGASGAVNSTGDEVPGALAAFASALAPDVASGALTLAAGKGTTASQLADLGSVVEGDPAALAAGLLACAGTALGDELAGARFAVENPGEAGEALERAIADAGGETVATGDEAWTAEADVLVFGSRAGVLDHQLAENLAARVLVPSAPLAFTPRALAVATRADRVVLPDFLTTAGPLAGRSGSDPSDTLRDLTAALLAADEGPVLGACLRAESFLSGWLDELPFGRPIG